MLNHYGTESNLSLCPPFQAPRREVQQGDGPAADDGAERAAAVVGRPGGPLPRGRLGLHRGGRRRRIPGVELQTGKGPSGDRDKSQGESRTPYP